MLHNKTAIYALLALYEIADQQRGVQHPPSVRAQDIAAKYRLPMAFVAKILSRLANAEVLHSDKGPRGGFRLNLPVKNITLYDIFDGAEAITTTGSPRKLVKGMPRPVQAAMSHTLEEADESVKKLLLGRTLAGLFKSR